MSRLPLATAIGRSLRAHGLVDPVASIEEAIVAAGGVYGSSPTSHLGLAARLTDYLPAMLEHERLVRRSVLRVPGMRGSVFLAPTELAPFFLALSKPGTLPLKASARFVSAPASRVPRPGMGSLTDLPASMVRAPVTARCLVPTYT